MNKSYETPNYTYASTGLAIETTSFRPDHRNTPVQTTISHIPLIDSGDESWERTSKALETPYREGRIGFTMVPPRDKREGDGTLEMYYYPWGGYVGNPVGTNELAMYAATHPHSTIIAVDSPATGVSERIPSSVSREIAKSGSYLPYGEMVVTALHDIFSDYDAVSIKGSSQGARRAVAVVAMMGEIMGMSVSELQLIDPVGSKEQSLIELAKAFGSREAAHGARYVEASPDRLGKQAQRQLDSPKHLPSVLGGMVLRRGLINQLIREPRAMARAGLQGDLLKAFPYVDDALIVSSPENSELTHPEDIERILEEILTVYPNGGPGIVESRLLKGQTHALFAGHPGTVGTLLLSRAPKPRE